MAERESSNDLLVRNWGNKSQEEVVLIKLSFENTEDAMSYPRVCPRDGNLRIRELPKSHSG